MATNRKFTNETPVEKPAEVVETITALWTKSVERLAEAQKNTLNVALEQNAEVLSAWKTIVPMTSGTQTSNNILELAANTFAQFVDLQKGAIDLAVEQGHALAGLAKTRVDSVSQATGAARTIFHDSVERSAATQKRVIEFSAAQAKVSFDIFQKQAGVAGTPVGVAAESIQRGFETFVETQKEVLDIASKRTQAEKATA